MPFYSTEYRLGRATPDHMDTRALARACNDDCRFQDAGWEETPASVELLLLSPGFQKVLAGLMTSGSGPAVGAVVASVYGCRVRERGASKRLGPARRTDGLRRTLVTA